uniref:Uncharacterized protein n=1 Tax=Anguilla anguilla TaxID=7936 RepID=A0A0E9TBD1_ANGAN
MYVTDRSSLKQEHIILRILTGLCDVLILASKLFKFHFVFT